MNPETFLIDGPPSAPTVVLAHGAGAPMDSEFMERMAGELAAAELRVVRFEFPYMAARRHTGKKKPPSSQNL
ncbi:MAG: alpha/beta family hydrolase, partial [Planctomycetota bacterium]